MIYLLEDTLWGMKVLKIGYSDNRYWIQNGRGSDYCSHRLECKILCELEGSKKLDNYLRTVIYQKYHLTREFFMWDEKIINEFKEGFRWSGKDWLPFQDSYNNDISTFDLIRGIKLKEDHKEIELSNKILKSRYQILELCGLKNSDITYHDTKGDWAGLEKHMDEDNGAYYNKLKISGDKICGIDIYCGSRLEAGREKYEAEMMMNGYLKGNLRLLYDILKEIGLSIKFDRSKYKVTREGLNFYEMWIKKREEN